MKHCIYMHKFPDGKVYIGQTRSGHTEKRWGKGKSYKTQKVYKAIEKYGWDNIEHVILEDGIPSERIDDLEREYIEKYDAVQNGYNVSLGGKNIENGHYLHKESPLVIHVLNLIGIKDLQDLTNNCGIENPPRLTDQDIEIFDWAYELINEEYKKVTNKSFEDYYGHTPIVKLRAEAFKSFANSIYYYARRYDLQDEFGEVVSEDETINSITDCRTRAYLFFNNLA